MEVPKGEIDASIQKATDIVAVYGGYVESTSSFGSDTGSVGMRVPVTKFERTLGALTKIGRVTARQINGTDVTAHFVDLKGRLQIAQQQRAVLLKLLAGATSIYDTLRLQSALNPVELNIEQLKGQIHLLAHQAAQSTIQVSFSVPGAKPAQQQQRGAVVKNPSFLNGVRHAVAGFLQVIVAVLIGLGYLIPVGVIALLVWLIVRRARRPREA